MKIIESKEQISELSGGVVLTIGNFDGVHAGHQLILNSAKKVAAERCVQLAVMTFEPHPLAVVAPARAPAILSTLREKTELLERLGPVGR